ncbi:UvrD-helicase domain-containing protein [Pseudomonas viridiflava]|uniref:UvrD-helicase domain-containing protein n=1 Tax=Pseudomonas viridiflava TaxID=33069 RepID=UPI0018E5AF1C|nr:UvrD-helicase domain-containing protein [Pseudomonas viridiflava]MBI6684351.1 UvrD-helicase domain-containing protein [Pseudomonas viridiflava]
MASAFWIGEDDLDEFQKNAVKGIPEDSSFMLTGPAGSGKTNILLLRSKWLIYKKISNIKIVSFTGSLKNFIKIGSEQYDLPVDNSLTAMQLFKDFLLEYDVQFETNGNFEEDRAMLAGKISSLLAENPIDPIYEALLVDEAQDYSDTELHIFRSLSERLVLACDSRQSIYRVSQTQGLIEQLTDGNRIELKYHYRSGYKICRVADGLLMDKVTYPRISGSSKYDEKSKPSSIDINPCSNFSEQISSILSNLEDEIQLYPGERLGVLFPKNLQVAEFQNALAASAFNKSQQDNIYCFTLHASKGWEFTSVHIGGCEAMSKMGAVQKRLLYTGILRGKTSVNMYHSGNVPGYIGSALRVLSPPPSEPIFSSLFGDQNADS